MKIKTVILAALVLLQGALVNAEPQVISCKDAKEKTPNQWIAFRKDFKLDKNPAEAIARIAVDSKYWMWINGKPVIFEGGLKKGPKRDGSYCDEVDIAPFLRKGENKIAILLWYFGKSGFSHLDSGAAQLYFDCPAIGTESGTDWLCRIHPSYGTCQEFIPNYRLPESSVIFDATKDIPGWQTSDTQGFEPAVAIGSRLGEFETRPIPQWKDFGVKKAKFIHKKGEGCDTLVARLPYNMQMTPVITLKDSHGGHNVKIQTNHIKGGGEYTVRGEYITKPGVQTYEQLSWMNGEEIHIIVPAGVGVKSIKYRETGYNADFDGKFVCDDPYINRFWEKAMHTLYVNMRDTYYDCPDRERAQWWGDATLLSAECQYILSPDAHLLTRKGIREICNWQKPDGTVFAPIPGNWDKELPAQMLAAVGEAGFWTYFMNTGDIGTINYAYPTLKKYLSVWTIEENGLTGIHEGGWNWGDWGRNRDIRLIQSAWYYMALGAACKMAALTGNDADIPAYKLKMNGIKTAFNDICWTGTAYRHPDYKEVTDDRVQALAVVSGIADKDKYPAIFEVFKTQEHASPYMEKYVMDALFDMGEGKYAIDRFKRRFEAMVMDTEFTTLWEGWGVLGQGYGGGSSNHAWSGGAVIVIIRKLLGINAIEPGFKSFSVAPVDGILENYECSFSAAGGFIGLSRKAKAGSTVWTVTVPEGSKAYVTLPGSDGEKVLNGGRHRFVVKK